MNSKGFTSVEAIAAFGSLMSCILITVPLISQINSSYSESKQNYYDALAKYELVKQLPSEGLMQLNGSNYASRWDAHQFCIVRDGQTIECLE